MSRRILLSLVLAFVTVGSLGVFAFGGGGGGSGGGTNPTWWPAGDFRYQGDFDTATFNFSWGTARLDNLFNIARSAPGYESLELDLAFLGSATSFYEGCFSYTDMPAPYSDCVTAGFSEVGNSISFGIGTYNLQALVANRYYYGRIELTMGPGALLRSPGEYLPSNLSVQPMKCLVSNPWSCGINNYVKYGAHLLLPQAQMDLRVRQEFYAPFGN